MNTTNNEERALLPLALRIAAATTEFDNIKVIPVNEELPRKTEVTTFDREGWEDKAVIMASRLLNRTIKEWLEIDPTVCFYVYTLAEVTRKNGRVKVSSRYQIK